MTIEKLRRFLVVSENPDHLGFFRGMMRENRIQDVGVCDDPRQAVAMLEAKRIQFAVIEREMTKVTGPLLIQKIRAERQFAYIPCLLFSKDLSEESVRLVKELGKDVLRVPLIKEQVWPVIKSICEREESVDPFELEMRQVEALLVDKQYTVALEAIKKATTSGPANARSLTLSGEALIGLDDLEKAQKSLELALGIRQNYYAAVRLLGMVYSRRGHHAKAIDLLSSMAAASPLNIKTLLTLGSAYSAADQLKKAREIVERVRSLDPENKEAALELGKIAFRQGNTPEAEAFLAEAEDAGDIGRFFNNYAIGLVNGREIPQAIAAYETAMRILRARAPEKMIFLQYNLGLALKKQGDYGLAFALLAECCAADPNYKRAQDSLISLTAVMRHEGVPYDKAVVAAITALAKRPA